MNVTPVLIDGATYVEHQDKSQGRTWSQLGRVRTDRRPDRRSCRRSSDPIWHNGTTALQRDLVQPRLAIDRQG